MTQHQQPFTPQCELHVCPRKVFHPQPPLPSMFGQQIMVPPALWQNGLPSFCEHACGLQGGGVGAGVGAVVQCSESALATPVATVGWVTVGQVGTVHVVVWSSEQMTSCACFQSAACAAVAVDTDAQAAACSLWTRQRQPLISRDASATTRPRADSAAVTSVLATTTSCSAAANSALAVSRAFLTAT